VRVANVRARVFPFAVSLDERWTASSDRGGTPLVDEPEPWTPEHLVLAALCRCVMTSLRHHARRAGLEVVSSAKADGTVTLRDEDGRFAFVEIAVAVSASLTPTLEGDALRDLLAKAERDCFVGASLRVTPAYRWTVDGREIG